jgi:polar amino acid transport system substrate-binding protein
MRPSLRLLLAALLTGWALAAKSETLHLATEAWMPYVYEANGIPAGLDYEVTREVLQRMGVELEVEFMPWKRCLADLAAGQADGILDIFRRPEREALMAFADEPLSDIDFVLFYSKAHPHRFSRIADLAGLKIGTSPGYWYGNDEFLDSDAFVREPGPSHEANLLKLLHQRVDLVINDQLAGRYLVERLGLADRIEHAALPVARERLYLAVRRTPRLQAIAERFSEELRRFKHEPAYRELLARYRLDEAH